MGERDLRFPPLPLLQPRAVFLQVSEGEEEGFGLCMSCVKKWLFINETADLVSVTNKVEAYLLFVCCASFQ